MTVERFVYRPEYPFDVDGMLGGLEKWLRILGFDAAFPRMAPRLGRIFVTKRKSIEGLNIVVVDAIKPFDQMRQVLAQTGIQPKADLLLTRCVACNAVVAPTRKEGVIGQVPNYVFETIDVFTRCPNCKRVYWQGSHKERIIAKLNEAGFDIQE